MRKLRSDITREGLARTPHRAFMRAMGLDDAAIQKPMIGVVSMKGGCSRQQHPASDAGKTLMKALSRISATAKRLLARSARVLY